MLFFQNIQSQTKSITIKSELVVDSNNLDEKAGFPGGVGEFRKFISNNLNIPKKQESYKSVVLTFIIEKDGRLSNIKIVRSSSFSQVDKEVTRVIKLSPKWIPGKVDKKAVRSKYTFPFYFFN